MGVAHSRTGPSWLLQQTRRLGLGRNPLRRRLDRIEAAIVLAAIVAALLMIPVTSAIGTAVRRHSEAEAAVYRATLTQAQARTLEAAEGMITEHQTVKAVMVSWTDQAGRQRDGRTAVGIGTKAGSEVPIWLDRSGASVKPPRSAGDSAARGGAVGLSTAMVSWVLIAGLARLAVVPIERRRLRDWEREWSQVSPR